MKVLSISCNSLVMFSLLPFCARIVVLWLFLVNWPALRCACMHLFCSCSLSYSVEVDDLAALLPAVIVLL